MQPDIINFETAHLSFQDKQASRRLLATHGYRFVDIGLDTLGIRSGFPWPAGTDDVDVFDTFPSDSRPGA